ncbi:MAG: flippase-like domain-containing protein [Anaerolineae bacterium]|nr:flippase-like domain-containing protein [Anaerolineae bacterium]
MTKRSLIMLGIGALISVGAILLLFSQVELDAFAGHMRGADQRYIAGMVALYFVSTLLRGLRWQTVLVGKLTFWRGYHIVNVGFLLNAIFPFRLGELARVVLMSREPGQNAGSGLSAVALERLLDSIFALLAVGLGLLLLPERAALPPETTFTLGAVLVLALVGVLVVLFLPSTHPLFLSIARFFLKPLPDGLAARLLGFVQDTLEGLRVLADPRRLAISLLASLVLWLTYYGYMQLGLYAFLGDAVPPLEVGLLILGFVAFGGAAPSLPGAVGIFQAAAVLALTTAGYDDTSLTTSYAWGIWVPQIMLLITVGMVSLYVLGLSLVGLTREVQAEMEQGSGALSASAAAE